MNPDPTGLMVVISRNTIMGGIRELRPGGQEAAKKRQALSWRRPAATR